VSVLAADGVGKSALDPAGRRRVLGTLCLTQITGWGVLYYAFPVLQGSIAADTGWTPTAVAGAFALGQVGAAVGGLAVGRVLDRHGPQQLMSGGSVLAALSCAAIAAATSRTGFYVAWLLAGAAMALVLYAPAFAAITGWFSGHSRLRALTALTVVGGLASTVFAPLTAWLHGELDWRTTYLVLGAVLMMTAPAHWWGLRGTWPATSTSKDAPPPTALLRSRAFLALTAALTVSGLCATAVVVNLVPLLLERGVSLQTASLLLALGGVGQVVGRIGYGPVARRLTPVGQSVAVLGGLTITTALLGTVGALVAVAVVVLLAGTARGGLTLLRATAVADRWGTRDYARLSAAISLPVALAGAAAPWTGSQLASWLGGHSAAFLALAGLNAAAVGLALMTRVVPAGSQARRPAVVSRWAAARR
jgi:MFS family permease